MKLLSLLAALIVLAASLNLQADEAVAYVVVEGDDIQTIAGTYEVSVEDIMITNGLETEDIEVGTVIYIPPPHAKGYYNPETDTYTVAEGDDMYEIAKRFGTTVDALVGYNDLPSTAIQTGQKLIIPK